MNPPVLRGIHSAALQAVPAQSLGIEPGRGAARLDDPGDCAGIDRLVADDVGRRPAPGRGFRPRRYPNSPEQRPLGDSGRVAPALERPHRAEFARAIGNADLNALAFPVALGEEEGDPQPVLALLEIGDRNAGELSPSKRASEA
jgi:hypothetical protein